MPQNNHRPLHVCLLSYRSNPHCGGQGVYLKNLSRALKDLGHVVDVISGPPDPQLDDDIPVYHLPCLDLYNPEDPFRIPTPHELRDPLNLIEWAINKRVPTIATIHHPVTVDRKIAIQSACSPWEKMKQWRWYSFIGMQKRVSRSLARIITVSKSAKKDISRDFNIPMEKFSIVPNGIDTKLFYPIAKIQREKNRVIVTNSADTPLKGLFFLFQAVAELAKIQDIHVTVVGEPKKDGDIVKLVSELGIGQRINFTGRIDGQEFVRQYARATIAVIPSVYEGFGLPVGEAMACGVPVISTTGGALPEVVGDAGVLVPPADSAALAGAIHELLGNPKKAKKLGLAGYKRVQEHFTWKRAAEKTVAAYREVLDGHRRI